MSFVKLDCGILESSLWDALPDRHVFITALLMARPVTLDQPEPQIAVDSLERTGWTVPPGEYGMVEAAGIGIIRRAGVEVPAGMGALERLGSPDLHSKSREFDGRRLVRVDGGFIVLNFRRYRDKDHTAAERMRRYRNRHAVTRNKRNATRNVTEAEAEAEAEKKSLDSESKGVQGAEKASNPPARRAVARPTIDDAEWIGGLESNAAYQGLNVLEQIARCRVWCETNGKACSRRRIVNWLNRAERPVNSHALPAQAQGLPLWQQRRDLDAEVARLKDELGRLPAGDERSQKIARLHELEQKAKVMGGTQ